MDINKGENKEELIDYKTVPLISMVAKLCETIIRDRWVQYLNGLNVFTKHLWIQKRKILCHEPSSLYPRAVDVLQEKKKVFEKVTHKSFFMENGERGIFEGKHLKMDGKLYERWTNENNNKL